MIFEVLVLICSRTTRRVEFHQTRTHIHRRRRMSYALTQGWPRHEREHERFAQPRMEDYARFARLGEAFVTQDCAFAFRLRPLPSQNYLPLFMSTRIQYEFERRKYAQDLIDFDKKFSALFSGKPRTDEFQDGVSHTEFLEYVNVFDSVLQNSSLPSDAGLHVEHSKPSAASPPASGFNTPLLLSPYLPQLPPHPPPPLLPT